MSFKRNVFANYASQLYVTGVGIIILPMYIKYMGAEAYGLVGFFTMLQAWFGLLDMGLSPTIARESARYHGGSMEALAYRQLFRVLSLIFVAIAVIGGGVLLLFAEPVASHWLKFNVLAMNEVVLAVQIMAVSVALRWMGGLYRGVITGAECLVWLSGFNALIATLRFIAVFGSMAVFGFTPFVFFTHQLVVAFLEIIGLYFMSHSLLPSKSSFTGKIGWSFNPVKPVLKFALTIAFTSSVWVLVTQTDKLVLSGILPLAEYGYFSLAVLAASGIMVISGPISSAIMPRMARLHAEGKDDELIRVYRNATQLVSVITGSFAITMVFCAKPLLFAWTGDMNLSQKSAPIFQLYAAGNFFLALSAFAYYLQYAKGNLRYHLIGSLFFVLFLIPLILVGTINYGAIGAGLVWLISNALFLFAWVWYVHYKIEPGMHLSWLRNDIFFMIIPFAIIGLILKYINFFSVSQAESLVYIFFVIALTFLISSLSSGVIKDRILEFLRKKVLIS